MRTVSSNFAKIWAKSTLCFGLLMLARVDGRIFFYNGVMVGDQEAVELPKLSIHEYEDGAPDLTIDGKNCIDDISHHYYNI